MNSFFRFFLFLLVLGFVIDLFFFNIDITQAFRGPGSLDPGTGSGGFYVDPNYNITFGLSGDAPLDIPGDSLGRVFTIASTTNPGFGLYSSGSGQRYVWYIKSDGSLTLWDATAGETRLYVNNQGRIGIGGTGVADAPLHIFGAVKASSFFGGSIEAENIMSGVFGEDQGGGNFVFPQSLGIGTSNLVGLPTEGLYVKGNVGIGTTAPGTVNAVALSGLSTHLKSSGTTRYIVEGTQPELFMWDSDAGVNAKGILQYIDGGVFRINRLTDAIGLGATGLAIDSSGSVGIGTTGPGAKLHVYQPATDNTAFLGLMKITGANSVESGSNNFNEANPSYGIEFRRWWTPGGAGYENAQAGIYAWGANSWASGLAFRTSVAGPTMYTRMVITDTGNVGIGTTNPQETLDVNGTLRVSNTATFNGNVYFGNQITSNLAFSTASQLRITGLYKLSVGTIDPVYEINNKKYATYVSDAIGLKVEHYGKAKLAAISNNYAHVIDFGRVGEGSDLWLFWQVIDEGEEMQDIIVNLTPEGEQAGLWYELKPNEKQIIVYGNKPVKFSYHLVAPRHDAKKWPTNLLQSSEKGTVLKVKD